MAVDISSYLTEDENGRIINSSKEMSIYIPVDYFDKETAIFMGNKIHTIGFFLVSFLQESTKKEIYYQFDISINVSFNFSEYSTQELTIKDRPLTKYHVFKLYENETFMDKNFHVKSLEDSKAFLNTLNYSRFPVDIPYSNYPDRIKFNFDINGIGIPVSSALLEIMMGELLRDSNDAAVPFRKVAGKTGAEFGYNPVALKDLPRLNSVFAGIAFEDIQKSIQQGIKITMENGKQNLSPLENVIYY